MKIVEVLKKERSSHLEIDFLICKRETAHIRTFAHPHIRTFV
jgi:hypothetical protein